MAKSQPKITLSESRDIPFDNTHIPMADLNNERVADQLSDWLRRKGLDRPRKGND